MDFPLFLDLPWSIQILKRYITSKINCVFLSEIHKNKNLLKLMILRSTPYLYEKVKLVYSSLQIMSLQFQLFGFVENKHLESLNNRQLKVNKQKLDAFKYRSNWYLITQNEAVWLKHYALNCKRHVESAHIYTIENSGLSLIKRVFFNFHLEESYFRNYIHNIELLCFYLYIYITREVDCDI